MDDYGAMFSGPLAASTYGDSRQVSQFPEPFFDMASLAMPQTIPSVLRYCEFLMSSQLLLSSAISRTISYFMTDVDIAGDELSDDEKSELKDYLVDDLHILDHAFTERYDDATYGNSFIAVVESFSRYFICPRCRLDVAFDAFTQMSNFRHSWADFKMHGHCPRCEYDGPWRMDDRRGGRDGELQIKHYSPHEMQILFDPYSHRKAYIWMPPEDYRRQVAEGRLHVLKYAPQVVLEAAKQGSYIRFADDYLFHGMTRTLSGIRNRGWGISRLLTAFRQAWYVQVLHRYNEAIGLDYLVPIRVITPAQSGGAGAASDPLMAMPMGDFGARVGQMVRLHRQDPATMHWFPFPVNYQALGGEASQMAPFQLVEQSIRTLLNGLDVPVELYEMSLAAQSAGPMLRIFESVHHAIPSNTNRFLKFVMRKVAAYKDWPQASARLLPTKIIDDISKQMPKLQLMASGQVSPQTGLAMLDLDAKEELRKGLDFQRQTQELQQKMQDDLEAAGIQQQLVLPPLLQMAQQGAQGAPGQPGGQPAAQGAAQPPPGGQAAAGFAANASMPDDVPVDPREIMSRAEAIAQDLARRPDGEANRMLRELKKKNEVMHGAVRSALERIRDQAANQGRDMVLGKSAGVLALGRRLRIVGRRY